MKTSRVLALAFALIAMLVACSSLSAGEQPSPSVVSSGLPHDMSPPSTPWGDPDMPVERCGLIGTVQIAFLVPVATEVMDWVPGLKGSPELEGQDGSLVVVYDGKVVAPYLTGIPGATKDPYLEGAVCVVTRDGEPNVYSDVPVEGLTLPAGVDATLPWDDGTICDAFAESPTCPGQ